MARFSGVSHSVEEIRVLIARHKRFDYLFVVIGLVCLMVGVLAFTALFLSMAIQGYERLGWDFFTSFPSRRAGSAGILSAWVGSVLVMLVTAMAAVPLGV
ncbi:MAG TPA: phosphate ABC transporter, permease protein PstA, partial [Burkholderiales bacterium]|nr:phosphate ABC transporter, permease protein PstA [Burkholderiales bacterium]